MTTQGLEVAPNYSSFTSLSCWRIRSDRGPTHVFDQERYATAAKECLQLPVCLYSHRNFSKRVMESARHDKALRKGKLWTWIARLGVNSRIQAWVRQHKSLKARFTIDQHFPLSENPPEDEYYRSWSYRWALDLLPFFLEKSAISLEVADVLRSRTFTMMGRKFRGGGRPRMR